MVELSEFTFKDRMADAGFNVRKIHYCMKFLSPSLVQRWVKTVQIGVE